MPPRHIVIVVVDGLRASSLGAYGNTMYPTPALDEFAAGSLLLDWCYAPAAELADVYRALWQSAHPARPESAMQSAASLPRTLAQHGYTTTLVTDAADLTAIAGAADFERRVQPADSMAADAAATRAADVAHTAMARLFAAACDEVASAEAASPTALWVHSRGLYGPWDAPLDFQRTLLDEEDPPPVEAVAPPCLTLGDNDDPDAIFRYACAYAAQVMVLDACWTALVEATKQTDGDESWLVMLLGARGYPLGEHRRIGGVDPRLYAEQLHVPWLLKFPDGRGRLKRAGQLVSPVDLIPTLSDWLGGREDDGSAHWHGASLLPLAASPRVSLRAALVSGRQQGHRALRTSEWCLRQDSTGEQNELYVRPDDRWEINDVAKLCPDVVDELSNTMQDELARLSQRMPMAHSR
jgi:arylsulfatase A-like enzyme